MKNKSKIVISIISGIIGGILSFAATEVSRSMCYYALVRKQCYAEYSPATYIVNSVIGFVVFYFIPVVIAKCFRYYSKKTTEPDRKAN
jgi:uncharacterized membrane protein